MEALRAAAGELVLTAAAGLIGLCAAYAVYGMKKLTEKVKLQTEGLLDRRQRELLLNALEDVSELTEKTVACLEQTTAKSLREAVKDGKADRKELLALSQKAAEEIQRAVGPEVQRVIAENFGSFESYLTACIEEQVLKLKAAE